MVCRGAPEFISGEYAREDDQKKTTKSEGGMNQFRTTIQQPAIIVLDTVESNHESRFKICWFERLN